MLVVFLLIFVLLVFVFQLQLLYDGYKKCRALSNGWLYYQGIIVSTIIIVAIHVIILPSSLIDMTYIA
jgi:hypothetical protein